MADFNQALGVSEAIRRGQALDDEGLYWIEEPVRADDFRGCADVAAAVRTPVQIGENFESLFEMHEALRLSASDFVMADAQRIGRLCRAVLGDFIRALLDFYCCQARRAGIGDGQLGDWFDDYNTRAPHSALGMRSPAEYRAEAPLSSSR